MVNVFVDVRDEAQNSCVAFGDIDNISIIRFQNNVRNKEVFQGGFSGAGDRFRHARASASTMSSMQVWSLFCRREASTFTFSQCSSSLDHLFSCLATCIVEICIMCTYKIYFLQFVTRLSFCIIFPCHIDGASKIKIKNS